MFLSAHLPLHTYTHTDIMFALFLQIYTDWANHYLAKSGCQRLIKDLSQDVTDGVLLAQIIQIIGTLISASVTACGLNMIIFKLNTAHIFFWYSF